MEDERDDSVYSDPEYEDAARKFLENIFHLGTLCSIQDIRHARNPILAGKIVKIMPFEDNATTNGPNVIGFTLLEAVRLQGESTREFSIFFLAEAANLMARAELRIRDYLAIRRPILFYNPMFTFSLTNTFSVALMVGMSRGNRISDIYGKIRQTREWHKVSKISPRLRRLNFRRKSPILCVDNRHDHARNTDERTSAAQSATCSDTNVNLRRKSPIPSLDNRHEHLTNTDERTSAAQSATGSDTNVNLRRKSPIPPLDNRHEHVTNTDERTSAVESANCSDTNDEIPNSLDAAVGSHAFISKKNLIHPPTKTDARTKAVESLPLPLSTESVSLKDVQNGMNVTVFGVILDRKKQDVNSRNNFFVTIEICDETCERFPVEFYLRPEEVPLTLRRFDIIKLTNMEVKIYGNKLYGSVRRANEVVTYARENPAITYQQTQSYEYPRDDKKRVKKLIRWMQDNVPEGQMFTRLCDIKNIATSVHLLGSVVQIHFFKYGNGIVLRFRDGTQTTQFLHEYDLSIDNLTTSRKEIPVKGSDFVDIVVIGADETFRTLLKKIQIGSLIELYHVRTSPQAYTYKTKNGCAVGLHFKAKESNLKIRETDSQLSYETENLVDVNLPVCSKSTENTPTKRKLFTDEDCIPFTEDIDSHHPRKRLKETEANRINSNSRESVEQKSTELRPDRTKANKNSREITEKNRTTEDEINLYLQEICKSKNVRKEQGTNRTEENEENLVLNEPEHLKEKKGDDEPIFISCRVVVPRADLSEIRTVPNSPEQNENMNFSPSMHTPNEIGRVLYDYFHDRTSYVTNLGTNAPTRNIDENAVDFEYLKEWPSDVKHEFYIKVSLISTLPVITYESNEKDVLSLINVHCNECKKTTPLFFVAEWIKSESNIPLCAGCKATDKEVHLKQFMTADLLVQDDNGKTASAIVTGQFAEQFFGCTILQLITSNETQLRVRNFIAQSKTLILKLKHWKTTTRSTRYKVLARG